MQLNLDFLWRTNWRLWLIYESEIKWNIKQKIIFYHHSTRMKSTKENAIFDIFDGPFLQCAVHCSAWEFWFASDGWVMVLKSRCFNLKHLKLFKKPSHYFNCNKKLQSSNETSKTGFSSYTFAFFTALLKNGLWNFKNSIFPTLFIYFLAFWSFELKKK